jgi:hypothetical protein
MKTAMLSRRDSFTALGVLLGVAVYAVWVGRLTFENRSFAVLATVATLLLGIVARNVAVLAVAAVAGVWVINRAPGLDVSYTDLLVAGTGALALTAGVGRMLHPAARIVLGSFAFFLGTLTITLAYNHQLRSDLEWFHRIALVAGAVLVGAWLVRARLHHTALRALLAVTVLMSLIAVADSAASDFAPAYPFGYQKNFLGSVTATVLLVVLAAPREFQLPARWLQVAAVSAGAGLLASQSRGAMIAFAAGVLIWSFRRPVQPSRVYRRRAILLLLAAALGLAAALSAKDQLQVEGGAINSVTQRVRTAHTTRQLWSEHPYTGVGLRYFKTPSYAEYPEPNDVVNEALAEAGVLGLLGFVVFVVGSLIGLGRLQGDLATAALCVVAARFVHGLLDIYWTGGTTSLPWIVAGMALATQVVPRSARVDDPPSNGVAD